MLMETCRDRDFLNDDLLASYQCAATLYLQNIYASVARITTFLEKRRQIYAIQVQVLQGIIPQAMQCISDNKNAHSLFLQQTD